MNLLKKILIITLIPVIFLKAAEAGAEAPQAGPLAREPRVAAPSGRRVNQPGGARNPRGTREEPMVVPKGTL